MQCLATTSRPAPVAAAPRRQWHRHAPTSARRSLRVCAVPEEAGQQASESERHTDASDTMSSLQALARLQGRQGGGTNMLLASDESDETWRKLDKRVNKYPGTRSFTCIGTGGSDFRKSMVSAVESVVGSVHTECVSERQSSQAKYISVTVGPVWIEDSEQVLQIYSRMRADERLRYFL